MAPVQPEAQSVSQASHDLSDLREKIKEHTRQSFLEFLDQFPGQKVVCFDPSLLGALSFVVEPSELRHRGVEFWFTLTQNDLLAGTSAARVGEGTLAGSSSRIRHQRRVESSTSDDLTDDTPASSTTVINLPDKCNQLIFLIRPKLELISAVVRIASSRTGGTRGEPLHCVVGFVPRMRETCCAMLRQQISASENSLAAVSNPIKLTAVQVAIWFYAFEDDVISLEYNNLYREVHGGTLEGSVSLDLCAEALQRLQASFLGGDITRMHVIGRAAKAISDKLLSERRKRDTLRGSAARGSSHGKQGDEPHSKKVDDAKMASLNAAAALARSEWLPPVPPVKYILGEPSHSLLAAQQEADESQKELRRDAGAPSAEQQLPGIESRANVSVEGMVLIDRRVDVMSLLSTQFTYSGLLDDHIGISQTFVDLPPEVRQKQPPSADSSSASGSSDSTVKSKVQVSKITDTIFAEICDLHQARVGKALHNKASEIQKTYKEKDELRSIAAISGFMKRFKVKQAEHASLTTHVNIAAYLSTITKSPSFTQRLHLEDTIMGLTSLRPDVTNSIESIISRNDMPVEEIYRLLSLLSAVCNGVTQKYLDSVKNLILQHYGFEELVRIENLSTAGLLLPSNSKSKTDSSWNTIRKSLNLIIEDPLDENDIAYVYSGYAPLSVRLVGALHKRRGWRDHTDLLNCLWGPAVEVGDAENDFSAPHDSGEKTAQVFLVVFVGGCTYAELAALRKLAEISGNTRRYLIVTTEMVNHRKLFASFKERWSLSSS